jgi:hypothetical protein
MLVDMPLVYICWLVLEYGDEYLANELLASELSNIGNVRAEDLGNKIRPYHGTETKKVSTKQCCSVPSYGGERGRYKYRLEGLVGPRESQVC